MAIVDKLGQVTNLQVVNLPTKIELLVSQKKDGDEIARELKVDGLVRTELAGQGEAMTVYVTVFDSTGHAVGKPQKFPASVSKISLIPNQVAEAVVNGLNVQLSASERTEIQAAETQIALGYGMLGDFESARRWLRQGLLEGRGDWSMLPFGKGTWLAPSLSFKRPSRWIPSHTTMALWPTPTPVLEIARKPSRLSATGTAGRNSAMSHRRCGCISILDSAKRTRPWIGWRNVMRTRIHIVGISRSSHFTTPCAPSRASRHC